MSIKFSDLQNLITGQRCADSPLYLIGVRGALENGYQKPDGLYDSVIFVVDQKAGTFTAWLASTDPSQPLIANPINPDGAAQLVTGVHLFERGIHKENAAWPCLIQAEDFTVYRLDTNGNVKGQESGDFGIHMHSGGEGEGTGRFSAGCQIYHNGDGYMCDPTRHNFVLATNGKMITYGISTVPYRLVDAADAPLDYDSLTFANPIMP
jgi:hypothetical protein